MAAPVLAEKRCCSCGETKPLSEFHRNRSKPDGRSSQCKPCAIGAVEAHQARVREQMGEDEYRAYRAEITRRSRTRTGNRRGREYARARNAAIATLIERHRPEFDHLLTLALRGELDEVAS